MDATIWVVILSIAAGVVPTIFYALLLWLADRHEKEPLMLLAVTFVWGAVPAIVLAIILEEIFGVPLYIWSLQGAELISSSVVAPLVEESVKALAVAALYLLFRHEFDGILDGIIYGALVGLGFAMTENVAYFLRSFSSGSWEQWTTTVLIRSLFFGLTHALYTGIIGASFGAARLTRSRRQRYGMLLAGWTIAVALHGFHNSTMGLWDSLLPAIAADWTGLLALVVLLFVTRRREATWIREELEEEVALGVLAPEDYAALPSLRERFRLYRQHYRQGGRRRASVWHHLTQLASDLAFKKRHLRLRGEDAATHARVARLRTEISRAQASLGRLQITDPVCPNCGHTGHAGSQFCTRCGTRLGTFTHQGG